jgi:peptidoglycan hydrolase-like protein with peptidoglycan-binding domain
VKHFALPPSGGSFLTQWSFPMPFACSRFSSDADIDRASRNNPPLRQGMRNDGVRVVQMAFVDLGFAMPNSTNAGASLPDGIFGSETAKITMAFQKASGLVADAVIGTKTLAQLDLVMATRSEAQMRGDTLQRRKAKGS